jgi:hypothetical protein
LTPSVKSFWQIQKMLNLEYAIFVSLAQNICIRAKEENGISSINANIEYFTNGKITVMKATAVY